MARTDRVSRLIKASTETIYEALIDPDARAAWLPPTGMTGRFERFEPRAGGGYRMILSYDDAEAAPGKSSSDSDVVEARFTEIVPDRRIVEAIDFESDDPAFAGTMRMIWDLRDVPDGTEVTVTAEDVPDGIGEADHLAGIGSSLDNLASYVE